MLRGAHATVFSDRGGTAPSVPTDADDADSALCSADWPARLCPLGGPFHPARAP